MIEINDILLVFAVLGMWISITTEVGQIIQKMKGGISKQVATGYSSAMKLMVVNRFGTISFLLATGLLIDQGATPNEVIKIALIAVLGVVFITSGLNYYVYRLSLNSVFMELDSQIESSRGSKLVFATAYFATILNISGLVVPLAFASQYPEYRLTLANTGFLFNTAFTLINVFVIEAVLAGKIDNEDPGNLVLYVSKILRWRLFGFITSFIFLDFLYFT